MLEDKEQEELRRRGHELEPLPDELIPAEAQADGSAYKYKMIWLSVDFFELVKSLDRPAEPSYTYRWDTREECVAAGDHCLDCDADGFCNRCGHQ